MFKSFSPDSIYIANGGQVGNEPDTGTFGSGYDFVTEKPAESQKAFSPWQLNVIERTYKNNILFRNMLKDIFEKYAKEHPELNEQEMKESFKNWMAAGAIGASAITGGMHTQAFTKQQDNQTPIVQNTNKSTETNKISKPKQFEFADRYSYSFSDRLINYIKSVENSGRIGWNSSKKLWFPHKSAEGGMPTIAYGHKVKNKQEAGDFENGITDQQALKLLRDDLILAKQNVYKDLKELTHKDNIKLTVDQEEMLIDFSFNLGTIRKFPKFTKAVLSGDIEGMNSQYKRFYKDVNGNVLQVKDRNEQFKKTFLDNLNEYMGFDYYFEDIDNMKW